MADKNNIDLITDEKIEKYRKITGEAIEMAKKNMAKGREKEAKEILEMAECYISDSRHFKSKGDKVNAFACLSYAHGWLDCGARLKIFNVSDDRLFTV